MNISERFRAAANRAPDTFLAKIQRAVGDKPMRKYKAQAKVIKDGNTFWLEINHYTSLNTPIRSQLTKTLELKPGDLVEISIRRITKVVK